MSTILGARRKFLTHMTVNPVGSFLFGSSGASLVREGHWELQNSESAGTLKQDLRNNWEDGVRFHVLELWVT